MVVAGVAWRVNSPCLHVMPYLNPGMSTTQNTLLIPHPSDLWAWVRTLRSLMGYRVTSTTWVAIPGHLHEQLHKADIFIQGFNVLHFFFSERKVKDLKQQKEKTGHLWRWIKFGTREGKQQGCPSGGALCRRTSTSETVESWTPVLVHMWCSRVEDGGTAWPSALTVVLEAALLGITKTDWTVCV